jgi:hypothetical protein
MAGSAHFLLLPLFSLKMLKKFKTNANVVSSPTP